MYIEIKEDNCILFDYQSNHIPRIGETISYTSIPNNNSPHQPPALLYKVIDVINKITVYHLTLRSVSDEFEVIVKRIKKDVKGKD